jgi:hypothetical protein
MAKKSADHKENTQLNSQLNARIPLELKEQFNATIQNGMTKQHVFNAMVRLWVSLPKDTRRMLVIEEEGSPSAKKDSSFVKAVRQIAEDVYKSRS